MRKYRRRYRLRRYVRRFVKRRIHQPIGSGENAKRFFKLQSQVNITADATGNAVTYSSGSSF
jgi:hypothetical protein